VLAVLRLLLLQRPRKLPAFFDLKGRHACRRSADDLELQLHRSIHRIFQRLGLAAAKNDNSLANSRLFLFGDQAAMRRAILADRRNLTIKDRSVGFFDSCSSYSSCSVVKERKLTTEPDEEI
jgi:hypothetical protein